MMNMDQLFKALPRDLQWEVLTEFTGTHVVRKGKLIKKIVFDDRHKILLNRPLIRQKIGIDYDTSFFWAATAVIMSNGRYLAFGEGSGSGLLAHGFRQIVPVDDDNWPWHGVNMKITYMDDSVVLPPFVKHSYPSYEDTEKKKAIRCLLA
jgi:hypothetical protein